MGIALHARDATVRATVSRLTFFFVMTVILTSLFVHRKDLCQDIWVSFGTPRRHLYIWVHRITLQEKQALLVALHPTTGCDTMRHLSVCGSKNDREHLTVVHGSCLSIATKKAALRLTYFPTMKKLDSIHPTQDAQATPLTAIQPPTRSPYGRWPDNHYTIRATMLAMWPFR